MVVSAFRLRNREIRVELNLGENIDGFGEDINITVYRVVQECLTNVVRHAEATRTWISVAREAADNDAQAGASKTGEVLHVRVRDDGKGLDGQDAVESRRFGLMGMRERVQALGGHLEISGTPGQGAQVDATIPLPRNASAALAATGSAAAGKRHD